MTMKDPKILIVEDEASCAMLLTDFLNLSGYEVCGVVSTGLGAVRAAAEAKPDVIFMDIRLADEVDGIEAASRIMMVSEKVSIIFMSAYSDPDIVAKAKKLNPAAYIFKPFELEETDRVIRSICEKD